MAKSGKDPERRLTAVAIRNISKAGRHADGGGLYLVVDPSGAKRWICRVVAQGRRRDIGLGGLSTVSLAEAREKAFEIRKSARSGGDPLSELRAAKRVIPTFAQSLILVHAEHKKSWKNKKHQDQWINTLNQYAVPITGSKRIDNIETSDILRVLQPIWIEKPETARRIRQRLSTVFKWSKASGFITGSNPVDDVEQGLARQKGSTKNFTAIPYEEVSDFWESLGDIETNSIGTLAFKFLILTASRTNEVLGARWSEVILEKNIWTIPASRMKAGKEHRVPFGPEGLKILELAQIFGQKATIFFPAIRKIALYQEWFS